MIEVRTNRARNLLVLFCVFLGGKSMITGEVNMNIWAVGTDDGKSTYEIRRKWGEEGKKALVIELYPTISVENCGVLDVSTMHLINRSRNFRYIKRSISWLFTGKPVRQN